MRGERASRERDTKHIVVIGQGAAGLSAALAAAEAARAKNIAVDHHAHRQGPRSRRRRQHPLDAVLHAHGRGRSRRAVVRPRHAGGDQIPGRRGLFRHARRAGPRHGAMDRRPRRAVPSAGLLSRQGPAAHPAGRRRRDHPPRADPRRARRRRRVPPFLRGRCADRRRQRRDRGRAAQSPARRCPPTPRS